VNRYTLTSLFSFSLSKQRTGIGDSGWRRANLRWFAIGLRLPFLCYYVGPKASQEFNFATGCASIGEYQLLPLGEPISFVCNHWQESCFREETMSLILSPPGVRTKLSRITVGTLHDLGYRVNYNGADKYDYVDMGDKNCACIGEVTQVLVGKKRPLQYNVTSPVVRRRSRSTTNGAASDGLDHDGTDDTFVTTSSAHQRRAETPQHQRRRLLGDDTYTKALEAARRILKSSSEAASTTSDMDTTTTFIPASSSSGGHSVTIFMEQGDHVFDVPVHRDMV
jgi:hypothetical protein